MEISELCGLLMPAARVAALGKCFKDKKIKRIKLDGLVGSAPSVVFSQLPRLKQPYLAVANDMDEAEFKKQVADFMDIIYKKAAECGGLISGEHGIGYGKMDYLAAFAGETSMRLMKGIKEVFDPKMILNPGKICYKL